MLSRRDSGSGAAGPAARPTAGPAARGGQGGKVRHHLLDHVLEALEIDAVSPILDPGPVADDVQDFVPTLLQEVVDLFFFRRAQAADATLDLAVDLLLAFFELDPLLLPVGFLTRLKELAQKVDLKPLDPLREHHFGILANVENEEGKEEYTEKGGRQQYPAHHLVHPKRRQRREVEDAPCRLEGLREEQVVSAFVAGEYRLAPAAAVEIGGRDLLAQRPTQPRRVVGYDAFVAGDDQPLPDFDYVVPHQSIGRSARSDVEQRRPLDEAELVLHRKTIYEVIALGIKDDVRASVGR